MAIVRRKKEDKEKKEAQEDEAREEREELVTDMETVKNAIQTCLDFEKEKGMHLINPKGRRVFSELYRKEEPKRRFEQVIDSKIDEKLAPMNKKMDLLLKLVKGPKGKEDSDDDVEAMKKKIDKL